MMGSGNETIVRVRMRGIHIVGVVDRKKVVPPSLSRVSTARSIMAVLSTLWSSRKEIAAAVIVGGGVLFYINRRVVDQR